MVKGRLKHKTGSRRLWILFETGGRKGPKQARQNYVNILETIQTSPNHTFLGFYREEKYNKISTVSNDGAENQSVDKRASLVRNTVDYPLTNAFYLSSTV